MALCEKQLNRIFLVITISLILVGVGNQTFAQTVEFNQINILDPVVILETELGNITIEFFYNDAPNHVENFIKLSTSGFYDGTIFHRIIPGFMIQGGDPNTISGDPSTWGQGGPDERVDAEFNTIKHNRGIVSMARSADPNSAGSQFFIVHKDSLGYEQSLDSKYSVFGRIVTEESFQTLDKIALVETEPPNRPINTTQVKITKVTIVNRSEVSNLLELPEPERTQSIVTPSAGNQKFESTELEITFSAPEDWLLQQPDKTQQNSPDVVAIGPKVGVINPVISLTVQQTNQRTLEDLISENTERLNQAVESENLKIISQEKTTINGYQAYVTNAEGLFSSNDETFSVKFKEVLIYDTEKFYTFAYSNDIDEFDSQLSRFEETMDSFEILSKDSPMDESIEEVGGCLIATATFGSEMAPQVQQLRELRDNKLLNTESGVSFMNTFNDFYYSFSPYIADFVVTGDVTTFKVVYSVLNPANIDLRNVEILVTSDTESVKAELRGNYDIKRSTVSVEIDAVDPASVNAKIIG